VSKALLWVVNGRAAGDSYADQRLRDVGAQMRQGFGECGRERTVIHALRRDAQHGFTEAIDGMRGLLKRLRLRIARGAGHDTETANANRGGGLRQSILPVPIVAAAFARPSRFSGALY